MWEEETTKGVSCATMHSYGFIVKFSFLTSVLSLFESAINLLCKEVASEFIAPQKLRFFVVSVPHNERLCNPREKLQPVLLHNSIETKKIQQQALWESF